MISIDKQKKIAIIKVDGTPSYTEIIQAIDKLLEHPEHLDGMDEIWDFSEASMTSFSDKELIKLSTYVKEKLPKLAKRTALVISKNVDYGIGRMWMAYAECCDINQIRHIFRSVKDALIWLE